MCHQLVDLNILQNKLEKKITDPIILSYMEVYKTPSLEEMPTENSPPPPTSRPPLDR